MRSRLSRLSAGDYGGAAVEFAMLAPLLLALLSGGVFYSRWFATAAETQNLAYDGARAAIAGLDDTERLQIVTRTMDAAIAVAPLEKGSTRSWRASRDGDLYNVSVTTTLPDYDLGGLVPMPPTVVTRDAVVVIVAEAGA